MLILLQVYLWSQGLERLNVALAFSGDAADLATLLFYRCAAFRLRAPSIVPWPQPLPRGYLFPVAWLSSFKCVPSTGDINTYRIMSTTDVLPHVHPLARRTKNASS